MLIPQKFFKIETNCTECGAFLKRWQRIDVQFKNFYCNFNCKANWQKKQHPVTDEWLRTKYIDEKLDCVQIGKLVNRHPKGVWTWLKNAGIETRKRGSDIRQQFQKGHKLNNNKKYDDVFRERVRQDRLRDGHYPKQSNGSGWWKGKSGPQVPSYRHGATPERQKFYDTAEWKEVCKVVWKRDNAICQRCKLDHRSLPSEKRRTFHIHHITSFAVKELRAVAINLVLLCNTCHKWVHSKNNLQDLFINRDSFQRRKYKKHS